ncbi:cilia- and flagella-associated protein 44 isoform X2 [Neocloeon triangulifer]|uniref:cilia- and flagella-associated protein 44 isoform X2 n=1 Tax=Neocloeon triangulifer TaxID=2078957 RepID=UPI00286F24E0|nr:cilia- and flagella-associated protein 44 isoform X2 [Neocloeon triangulifer]
MDLIVQNIVCKSAKNIKEICREPVVSDEGMVNCISLTKSFGYDSIKLHNLCAIENTVIYVSGNIIHFLDTQTGKIRLQRSVRCTGIGHITANHIHNHLAVGERGNKPSIYILTWPKLDVVSVLTNGTEKSYSYLDYNTDGTILCSLGAAPDYTLALWDWENSVMLVKTEAANRPVYKAAFSKLQPDVIVSGGDGHIKFWQSAKTFTGRKLSFEIGKFGSCEMSNTVGFEFLDDGKVASGCQWGNILVWANNELSFEVTTRRPVTCHQGPVLAFHMHNAWLISIGTDGWVRAWDLKKVSSCEQNDRLIYKSESVVYFTIGEQSSILSKVELPSQPSGLVWLLQDGLGAIWLADVGPTLAGLEQAPSTCKQLLKCHGGGVISLAISPFGPFFASAGPNGKVLFHNYDDGAILEKSFEIEISSIAWFPQECSNLIVIIGFENGSLSLCFLDWGTENIVEIEGIRPHEKPVTRVIFSPEAKTLVSVSEDHTIFLITVDYEPTMRLIPVGSIHIDFNILTAFFTSEEKIIICGEKGQITGYSFQDGFHLEDPDSTFRLKNQPDFEKIIEIKDARGLKIMHSELRGRNELVLFAQTESLLIIVKFDVEDKSFVELKRITTKLRLTCACVSSDELSCVMGFETGEIQFNTSALDNNEKQQQMWARFWRIRMHESERGCQVSAVGFSHDGCYIFSSGADGSIFMYKIASANKTDARSISKRRVIVRNEAVNCKPRGVSAKNCTLSIEKVRRQKAEKRISVAIAESKELILKDMAVLRDEYQQIKLENKGLTMHSVMQKFFDEKVKCIKSSLLDLVQPRVYLKRDEWKKVFAQFLQPLQSTSLKISGIGEDCFVEGYLVAKHIKSDNKVKSFEISSKALIPKPAIELRKKSDFGLFSPNTATAEDERAEISTFGQQRKSVSTANQVAEKLKKRQLQRNLDNKMLEDLIKRKPTLRHLDLNISEEAMGVYKLKTDAGYSVPEDERIGLKEIQDLIASTRIMIFNVKFRFNKKLVHLKRERQQIMTEIENSHGFLDTERLFLAREEELDDYLYQLCTGNIFNENFLKQNVIKSSEEIMTMVTNYDAKVRSLIEERLKSDVNNCLLKQWNFLNDQKRDIILHSEDKRTELKVSLLEEETTEKSLQENMLALQGNLEKCREEVESFEEQINKLEEDVNSAVDGTVFYEHLMLLYKKEYRPPSLSIASSVTEGSEENRSGTSSAGSSSKGVSEKICPSGCDPELFDYVNQCRLLRYEIELRLMESNRILSLMLKDEDVLKKKIKLAQKNIKCINANIDNFYRERQSKINELQIAVPLKLHQIPAGEDFSKCVLISLSTMNKLGARSGELQAEAADLDSQYQQDVGVLKDIKGKTKAIEEEINQLKAKMEETMIQRFGKIVDIVELEQTLLGCEIENFTKPAYSEIEQSEIQFCKKLEVEIQKIKGEIVKDTEEKTKKSQELAELLKEINSKNSSDNSKHKNCNRAGLNERRCEVRRMNELVLTQKEQIAAIRYELGLLRCKVASSRDLLATEADELSFEDGEILQRKQIPSWKSARKASGAAPEIRIQHCENDSAEEKSGSESEEK